MGVLEERAEVEKEIEGETIADVLQSTASQYPDAPAFTQGEETLTWSDVRQRVLRIAAAFTALGLEPGETVALMMPNRTEHVLADLGVVHAGGIPTTFYATLAPEQVAYVAADCTARYAVLDGPDQLERWRPILSQLPDLRAVIVLNDCPSGSPYLSWESFLDLGEGTCDRWRDLTPDSTLTILYTSGTTGRPKGVVISHSMALYECRVSERTASLPSQSVGVSYLPFAHIADRVVSIYVPLVRASHVYFCPDPAQLAAVLAKARPHGFFGVPRVWEKMMAAIQAALGAEQDESRRDAVAAAMEAGRAYVESCEYGRSTTPEVLEAFLRAEEAVLSPIRSLIGLDRAQHTLSAAAPLPIEVARFFAGLGLRILDVYGMTETTGAVTANTPDAFKLGTVGRAMPGIEIRLAEDGEILVRGGTCTHGYLNLPSATADLLDADGWVHTGDLGAIDADGFLSVVDRKKEIMITAGGENIAPSLIENLLKEHPLVGQALAYGDGRRYVVAVLTLDPEVAPVWAAAHGVPADLAAMATDPAVLEEISSAVDAANARLARVQQVKRWRLLPDQWTAESEELTPTLKLKRRVIHAKYAGTFDTLYP
ncbi:AMP-dependent synthetase/ligase [Actinoallomurus bryophytorum]|uniref:Acyl-CoA synthetase n=1 Tax=Actinoallomurus bryophytorum TaxID=1490222 RepID=A0A543CWH0_9ACTN|nr:AMP-dependent synthetase/ligase [Actinoallomurus bryophytorum]TQM01389.1 long-chain acyl-CoA synthetase [Actinoallomurus bryophytorum]